MTMGSARAASVFCALALVLPAAGCRKPPAAQNQGASSAGAQQGGSISPPQDAPKPVPEQLPDVLARVDGHAVTKADFERFITQMEMNAGQQVPKEQRNDVYRRALDQLITIRLLTQEVASRNVEADNKAVDEQMQKIRSQFPSEDEYRKALGARGVTPEQLREDMLNESRINKMMQVEAAGAAPVTDAEIREFYEKNPARFRQPETVRASHILIRAAQGDDAARKKARTTIEGIHKQALAGRDFGDLARKYSEDGSAERGGDLGFFPRDRMVPEFAAAAFALKVGQISGIVETSYGYHIIKLMERRPASDVPLAQVTAQVREYLTQQRRQQQAEAFVKVLRSKSKIEVLI